MNYESLITNHKRLSVQFREVPSLESGREVDPQEHRFRGRVFVARPAPDRKTDLPKKVQSKKRRALVQIEEFEAKGQRVVLTGIHT